MLDIKRDRLNYWDLLRPDEDYIIDNVLVTTYSLDMEALTGLSLLLGLDTEYNEDVFTKQVYLFNALKEMSKRITIVCQKGNIKVPKDKSSLNILLEKCIHTINIGNGNFHPKVWFVKYKNGQNIKYKLIVSSKNLTYDRSWDTQICMQGERINVKQNNQSIIFFLDWIKNNIEQKDAETIEIIEQMEKELEYIKFDTSYNNYKIEKCEFIQFGETNNKIEFLEKSCTEKVENAFIISPFITKSPINNLRKNMERNNKITLITRREELNEDLINNLDVYVINNDILNGEDILEEDSLNALRQDIHSKIFIFEAGQYTHIYIGSANATKSAFYNNIEVMIHLQILSRNEIIDFIKKELIVNDENYFVSAKNEDIIENTEDNNEEKILRDLKQNLLKLKIEAKLERKQDKYNIKVYVPGFRQIDLHDYQIKIKPFLKLKTGKNVEECNLFPNLSIEDLSELFILELKKNKIQESIVIRIPVQNMPENEERIKAICKNLIKSKEEFMEYINVILDDRFENVLLEAHTNSNHDSENRNIVYQPAIYEKMLKSISKNPDILNEIKQAIDCVDNSKEKMPKNFYELYKTFEKVVEDFV